MIAKTLDPQWDEVHNFAASLQSARRAKLQVEVFDNDFLSRDDSLGVGEIELSKIFGDEVRTSYITPRASAGHLLSRVIAQLEEQSQRRPRRAKSDPGELQRTLPVGRTFDYKLRLSIKGHVDISITLEKVSWNV